MRFYILFFFLQFAVSTIQAQYTWTLQHSDTTLRLNSVIWTGNQFVAVGSGGAVITSDDGETWTQRYAGSWKSLRDIAFMGTRFVAVGDTITTSTDGKQWTNVETNGDYFHTILYGDGRFFAGGNSIQTSVDGISWEVVLQSDQTSPIYDIIWTGSIYVAIGDYEFLWTSSDGRTWNQVDKNCVPYGLGTFAWDGKRIIGAAGNNEIYASTDAIQWTHIATLPVQATEEHSGLFGSIKWFGNVFILHGSNRRLYTSLDGETWLIGDIEEGTTDAAFTGEMFLVVGDNGNIYTSPVEVGIKQCSPANVISNTFSLRSIGKMLHVTVPALLKQNSITIEIYDLSGKQLYRHRSFTEKTQITCSPGNLAAGSYFVLIKNGGLASIKPWYKIH
jgi:hypothetical protein